MTEVLRVTQQFIDKRFNSARPGCAKYDGQLVSGSPAIIANRRVTEADN